MTRARFIKGLSITTVITVAILFLINFLLGAQADWMISIYGMLSFTAISIFMYFLGDRAVSSADKFQYIRLIIFNTILKIFVSFLVVGLYFHYASPTNNFFILLFLISYLSYTIFETYFMVQQSK